MAVKIGASSITAAYLGTTRVRHIYLGKSLVFSDMVNHDFYRDGSILCERFLDSCGWGGLFKNLLQYDNNSD